MRAVRHWRPISYFVTCEIWLSLEHYWNAGMDRERAKEIIERMPDPGSATLNLRCLQSGRGNWIVRTSANTPEFIGFIVDGIKAALDAELDRMTASKETTTMGVT